MMTRGLAGGGSRFLATAGLCLALGGAHPGTARAQTLWTGSNSDNWFTAGNWNPAAVPGSGTSVQLNTATPNPTVIGTAGAQANQLTLGSAAGQTGNLTVSGAGTLSLSNNVGVFLVGDFGTGTVTVSGGGTLSTFTSSIGNNAGSTGTVTVTGTNSRWNVNPIFAFHVGSSSTGTLNVLAGGTVASTGGMDVGGDAGGNGTVLVSGDKSLISLAGTGNIGLASQGKLTLEAGGDMTAGNLNVGSGAIGTATVTGAGSTLGVTSALRVGFNTGGAGTMTVQSGAVVTSGTGHIGVNTGASGNVTVTGENSRWTVTNNLLIGQATNGGTGELHVLDKGRVDAASFTGHNSAKVEVDGSGSQLNLLGFSASSTTLTLGATGADNRLDVTDGAKLATRRANLATVAGSAVTATISGSGTSWDATGITIGGAGTSTMTVTESATVNVIGDFIVDGSEQTSLTISKGAHVVQDPGTLGAGQFRLGVDGHGALRIESGGILDTKETPGLTGFAFLARNSGSTASATITGEGSTWNTEGLVSIGSGGSARLEILDGGKMTGNASATIGFLPGSEGEVLVSGEGSSWILDPPADDLFPLASIRMGLGGTGEMRIAAGAHVQASGIGVGSSFTDLFTHVTTFGNGHLVVTGEGTTVDLDVGAVSSFDAGGDGGTGVIEVLDGAVVTVDGRGHFGASIIFDRGGGVREQFLGHGTLTVDGAGSRVVYADTLDIGEQATGVLNIRNGGFVSNSDGYLGSFTNIVGSAGNGTATVTGTGSKWQNSGFLRVGDQGTGELNVLAGGTVTNTDAIIANAANSIGKAKVAGTGSTWTSSGNLAIGNLGAATLTVAESGIVNAAAVSINALSTLNIGEGGAAGAINTAAIANNGLIRFDHTDGVTFATPISGSGALTKTGSGLLTLSGVSTYSGATTVSGGTLAVSGSIANSTTTVALGARLMGTGTLGGLSLAGTLAPGNSIGTLKIAGDGTIVAGSTYEVEIAASGESDLLAAEGSVTLSGGQVVVQHAPGTYVPGTVYTIVTATDGVSGTFAGVTDSLPFLDAELSYEFGSVLLTLVRNDQSFAEAGVTPNQKATGAGIDSLDGGPLPDALAVLDETEILAALDSLSGEIHASLKSVFMEESRYLREAAIGRLRSVFGAPGGKPPMQGAEQEGLVVNAAAATEVEASPALWGTALGAAGSFADDGNAAKLERSTVGFLAGIDAPVLDDVRLGLIGGYSYSSFDVDDRSSSGSSDNVHIGVYGGVQHGAFGLRAGAAQSWHFVDTSRKAAFGDFSETLDADYDAGTTQVFGEAGLQFGLASASFEPFAGIAYVNVHTDGFTETKGAAALEEDASDWDQTFTTLGLRATVPLALRDHDVTLSGVVGWRHAFGEVTPEADLSFAGGSSFEIAGTAIARDALALQAGIDVRLGANAGFKLAYSGQIGDDTQDHGVTASLAIDF